MKPRAKNKEQILSETLNLFGKVSTEEAESARAQTLTYVESHTDEVVQGRVWDADSVRPVQRRQWLAVATIAAAIAIAVVLPVTMLQRAPAVLEDAAGSRKIEFGEVVRSNGAGETLVLPDGSRVEMRSKSELLLERADDGVRIRLHNGGIIVNAARQRKGHLYVETKDVTVSVVGTVFLVNAGEEGSRVAVIEGEVHVQQGATETKLRPGEQVTSNPKMESLSVKQEVAWSREAVAHAAMLQQAATVQTPREERVAFEVATIRPAAPRAADPGPNARGGAGGGGSLQKCHGSRIQLDPRRISFREATLYELVGWAHGRCVELVEGRVPGERLSGGAEWMMSERWDIEALIPEGSVTPLPTTAFGGPIPELQMGRSPKVQSMIRTMLEERFKLVIRREMKEMPVYALTVAPGGTKFQGPDFDYGLAVSSPMGRNPDLNRGTWAEGMYTVAQGASIAQSTVHGCRYHPGQICQESIRANMLMSDIARSLSGKVDRPVIDRTGIQERVSFLFEWVRTPNPAGRGPDPPITFQEFSKALEAVGLLLKDEPKGLVETFVIERAEKPSEN